MPDRDNHHWSARSEGGSDVWAGECSCGWSGEPRLTANDATRDAEGHVTDALGWKPGWVDARRRIEVALMHLGLNGPLDLAEDALAALDTLVAERRELTLLNTAIPYPYPHPLGSVCWGCQACQVRKANGLPTHE